MDKPSLVRTFSLWLLLALLGRVGSERVEDMGCGLGIREGVREGRGEGKRCDGGGDMYSTGAGSETLFGSVPGETITATETP